MTTAVIYTGQARTFKRVFENQYFHVLRKLPDPEFFVSVADDEQAPDMYRLLEKFPADKVHIEIVSQPTLPELPPDPPLLAMYPPSSSPQAILRQLWALQRGWEFACDRGADKATYVLRIRPDLAFYRCELPSVADIYTCLTPWWSRWGGVNDRMAFINRWAASAYFRTYSNLARIRSRGCPLHPETLIAASLELGGMVIRHTLATEFATVRLDGTIIGPTVTDVDRIEYARTQA
jgi:hypothetical protein